jgi:hypothetical protein
LTFDYYIEQIAVSSMLIGFYGSIAEGIPAYFPISIISSLVAGTGWIHNYTSETYRIQIPKEINYLNFVVWQIGAGNLKLYLKNIQIVKVSLITDPVVPYVKPNISNLTHTGTIAVSDTLLIDNDTFTSEYYTYITKIVSNGMINLSGNPIFVNPGNNTLRYLDARVGATHPETESCGGVNCSISYRARYL